MCWCGSAVLSRKWGEWDSKLPSTQVCVFVVPFAEVSQVGPAICSVYVEVRVARVQQRQGSYTMQGQAQSSIDGRKCS